MNTKASVGEISAEPAEQTKLVPLRFPTMLRKMWSGGDVQDWLDRHGPVYVLHVSKEAEQHPDDMAVERFARVMQIKLAQKRTQGGGGWEDRSQCSNAMLSQMLREHVEKGDPVDVANLAMMIHQRGETIAKAKPLKE